MARNPTPNLIVLTAKVAIYPYNFIIARIKFKRKVSFLFYAASIDHLLLDFSFNL